MPSITKSSKSLSKLDLPNGRMNFFGVRKSVFYHKALSGSKTIDLSNLTMPSTEFPSVAQITLEEITASNLFTNKKNLKLSSVSKGELFQGLDYVVTSSTTIKLIGIYDIEGAEADEIFVGEIALVPLNDVVPATGKIETKTYDVAIGQTTIALGKPYKIGVNPLEKVGAIKVFINGALALRSVDYNEVDSGNGYGSTIQLITTPVSALKLAVDFGLTAITDNNSINILENMGGILLKLATDLSVLSGQPVSDYYNASASEIERADFGQTVLNLINKKPELPIGSVVQSMLTQAQFQAETSAGWVLMDGRSVTGSAYHTLTGSTTIPDARGVFLRSKNNGRADGNQNPDGDSALGTFQDDAFESHTHTQNVGAHSGSVNDNTGGAEFGYENSTITGATGGNETRPKNITVNTFIRIN